MTDTTTIYELTAEDWKTFFIHDLAMDVIKESLTRTREVGELFGYSSEIYIKMSTSLSHCLAQIFSRVGFGRQMRMTRDGQLSLLCVEADGFVFGMNFSPNRTYDNPPEGRPQPGTWSLNS